MNVKVNVKGGRGGPSLNHLAPTAYFAKATKARERGPTEGSEYRAGRFDLETVALQRQPHLGHMDHEGCPQGALKI